MTQGFLIRKRDLVKNSIRKRGKKSKIQEKAENQKVLLPLNTFWKDDDKNSLGTIDALEPNSIKDIKSLSG